MDKNIWIDFSPSGHIIEPGLVLNQEIQLLGIAVPHFLLSNPSPVTIHAVGNHHPDPNTIDLLCPFLLCINEIVRWTSFVSLLLNIMLVRLVHKEMSFSFLFHYKNKPQDVYPFFHWWTFSFLLTANTNGAEMNIFGHVFWLSHVPIFVE